MLALLRGEMRQDGGDLGLYCQTAWVGEHTDNVEAWAGRHACIFAAF